LAGVVIDIGVLGLRFEEGVAFVTAVVAEYDWGVSSQTEHLDFTAIDLRLFLGRLLFLSSAGP
jgi:hypothetical protein